MSDLQIRPTIATDLPRLMGIDHSTNSDSVWQLELRRDVGQITAAFREVRLPRSTSLSYPHNPHSLGDDWVKKSMMYTALIGSDPAGYISMLERGTASSVWVTDLVVDLPRRRQGVGGSLLTAAQNWAQERSHRRLILEMQSKNIPAIRLAQKYGYEFCGYNDHYYLTQDVALFFSRILK
jgi:GNAT superfamily N-acetyltransferase